MVKVLELIFENMAGRTARFSLESPVEPVDPAAVAQVMDEMIARNIFTTSGGDLVAKRGARLVAREVTEIELP